MSAKVAFNADDKIVNQNNDTEQIKVKNLDVYFEIERCSDIILRNEYYVVALQFPDELMSYSNFVSKKLEILTKMKVYILADTSYGSCCIDEVAASHYSANVIIHYGQTCLSYPEKIPVIYVFGNELLDIQNLIERINENFQGDNILLFFDVQYEISVQKCKVELERNYENMVISTIDKDNIQSESKNLLSNNRKFGRNYNLKFPIDSYTILFVGDYGRTLYNIIVSYNKNYVYSYNPNTNVLRKEDMNVNRYLMRRYYLIEKAKDSQIVGIMMGTLGVSRYREMVARIKKVLKVAGKKFYTFVVGKVNPAKLANFMEIDIFVLIACPENSLIDSKEFYKPIVTPFEMEIACLKSRSWTGEYVTDFTELLPGCASHTNIDEQQDDNDDPDFSFITGKMRICNQLEDFHEGNSNEIVERNQNTTVSNINPMTAGEYLSSRMWSGLQVDSGNTAVTKAVEGRSGIAMNYVAEG